MLSLPSAAELLLMSLSVAFTEPTFQWALLLAVGAILALGRRTVTAMLWTMRGVARGHPQHVPPRLLPRRLVAVAPGEGPGRGRPWAPPAGPAGPGAPGRHHGPASRQARLRQGLSPRRRPFLPLPHRLAVTGPQIISLFTARCPIETTFQEMRRAWASRRRASAWPRACCGPPRAF